MFFLAIAFVSKLSVTDGKKERATPPVPAASTKASENSRVRRLKPPSNNLTPSGEDEHSDAHDADSEGSSDSSGLSEFDVFERQGYDKIIQSISTGGQHQDDYARQVCSHLEIFESLTPGR